MKVINSIGRCGSTMMLEFCLRFYKQWSFVRDLRNLNYREGYLIKTHSRYCKHFSQPTRIIYMFANPMNVAISTSKMVPLHFDNMQLPKINPNLYKEQDVFQLEHHFDQWNKPQPVPTMLIKFEQLYECLPEVFDFLELPKNQIPFFPEKRKRNSSWVELSEEDRDKLKLTYGRLSDKMKEINKYKVYE